MQNNQAQPAGPPVIRNQNNRDRLAQVLNQNGVYFPENAQIRLLKLIASKEVINIEQNAVSTQLNSCFDFELDLPATFKDTAFARYFTPQDFKEESNKLGKATQLYNFQVLDVLSNGALNSMICYCRQHEREILQKLEEKMKIVNGQASKSMADIRIYFGEDIPYNMENKNKRQNAEKDKAMEMEAIAELAEKGDWQQLHKLRKWTSCRVKVLYDEINFIQDHVLVSVKFFERWNTSMPSQLQSVKPYIRGLTMAQKTSLLGIFKHSKRTYSAVFNFPISAYVWGVPLGVPIRYLEPTLFVQVDEAEKKSFLESLIPLVDANPIAHAPAPPLDNAGIVGQAQMLLQRNVGQGVMQ